MAVIQNPDDDEEAQLNQPVNQQGAAPALNSGSGVGGKNTTTGTSSPTATPNVGIGTNPNPSNYNANQANQSNGGVVDLSQYVKENQGGINNLSNATGNFLSNQANNANQTINSSQNQFNNDVGTGTVKYNSDLVNQALSNPTGFVGASTSTNPNSNLSSFLNQENAAYTGPSSFQTSQYYMPALSEVNQVTGYGNGVNSQTGKSSILQAMNNGQLYDQGSEALDQALLGSTPTSQATLNQASAQVAPLTGYLQNATDAANQTAAQGAATTANTKQQVQNAVQQANTNFQNNINNEVTNAQQTALANQTALQNLLQNYQPGQAAIPTTPASQPAAGGVQALTGTIMPATAATVGSQATSGSGITPQQLAQLGITQSQLDNLSALNSQYVNQYGGNTNLSQWFTPGTTANINANNVATAQDYATENALGLLAPTAGYNNYINTPNAAASAPTNLGTFDYQTAGNTLTNDVTGAMQGNANRAAMQNAANTQANAQNSQNRLLGGASGAIVGAEAGSSFGPVGTVVGGVVGAVAGAFCHYEDTIVIMDDGSHKLIQDIVIGDIIANGGLVKATKKELNIETPANQQNMYKYLGDFVSGEHAVLQNGEYIRVKDSKYAESWYISSGDVYPLITQYHNILTLNALYADFEEIDGAFNESNEITLQKLNHLLYSNWGNKKYGSLWK